ncbi:MAG: zinc-ribbon domain containing protein [Candidatus Neomarinimicrobiota bacterium]
MTGTLTKDSEDRVSSNRFQGEFIQYSDCGTTFSFSAEERGFSRSKSYTNEPMRCSSCRRTRKSERYGDSRRSPAPDVFRNLRRMWQKH